MIRPPSTFVLIGTPTDLRRSGLRFRAHLASGASASPAPSCSSGGGHPGIAVPF